MWNTFFSVCGLWATPFWVTKRYVQVSPDKSLCKTQSESAERNLLSTVTVFQRLGAANVTDLCRNSLAEQTDMATDSCLMVN